MQVNQERLLGSVAARSMAWRLQGCEQVGYVGVLSVSTRILQINLCLGFWYLLVTEIETLIKIQFQNYF